MHTLSWRRNLLAKAVTYILLMDCLCRVTADFWQTWKEFEVKHGNEDTLREMLRIKRSVQAVYNTQVYNNKNNNNNNNNNNNTQVNMMASAMMKETGPIGTVSDLAPTLTLGLKDDMWRLEAKGSESDVKVRPQRCLLKRLFNILFRSLAEQRRSRVTSCS